DAIFTQNNVSSATALLPASVTQQGVTTQKTQTGFLLVYALHSDGRYDDRYLSNYAYINLQNELLKIEGVGKVEIMGAGEYSMRVWLRPDRMEYYNLSLAEVTSAIESQADIYPTGQFGAEPSPSKTEFTYTVTLPPQISTPEEYADIVLRTLEDGSQLRLSDIAEVTFGSESYGTSSTFGNNPSAMIVIYQTPNSNAMQVGTRVKAAIEQLSGRFPDGVEISTIVDTTTSINAGIREILYTLLLALLLVIIIIYLFIQDWRATLIPLIAVPVSLIGTFIFFPLLGFSINIISLLGVILAIGLVVDDGIVVVEAVQVNIERGMPPRKATLEAMHSVASPIIATTVVLLAVFIPVSLTGGITGRLFQQFSITIAISVAISAFNALTLSPALSAMLLRPKQKSETGFFGAFNRWFERMMTRYSSATGRITTHLARTSIFVAVVLGVIVALWRVIPTGFLPEEDQGYIMVMVNLPEASSLHRTEQVMAEVDRLVSKHDAVLYTAGASGFDMITGIQSSSNGIIFVALKDFDERRTTAAELAAMLNEELYVAINSAEVYAVTPPAIPGMGVTSGVEVQIQDLEGRGLNYLAEQSREFMTELEQLPEIASVTTQFNDNVPQRRLDVNRDYALSEGVDLAALYDQLSAFLGGSYINNFNRFGRLYRSYLQAAPEYRTDAASLDSYFVQNGAGESVPVAAFVRVVDTVGVEYVSQFNLYRSIALTVNPADGKSSAQVMDAIESQATKSLPDDVGIAWSGISFQQRAASKGGAAVYALAVIFVFLALAALYNSWSLPIAIILSVPLAVMGALAFIGFAHLFNPKYINDIFIHIAIVMLIGLAAKNAILVVEYADRLFFDQRKSLLDAAIGAAQLRVRPILMTAFAFILGVAPLIFAHGAYSNARNTMGVALVGGMLVATLAGIFLYPALYYLVGRLFNLERKREQHKDEPL
ncbi:MAG: efflux RND transporter permease subunit, partial [Rikenellaceae bacterium]|nr:efflux RND transporter permease subunit [Rikenellaceae bacterium]